MTKQKLFSSKPFNALEEGNRRSDASIRNAIDAIQNLLFDPQASDKIFPLMLKHMEEITKSDFSVIVLSEGDTSTPIELGVKQSFKFIHVDNGAPFIVPKTVSQWIEQRLLPLRPVFFNDSIPKSHSKLVFPAVNLKSLMIFPIINRNKLQAICFLGKNLGEYCGDNVRRVRPLLGSVICALQSADSVKGNLQSFNKKISDNRFLSTLMSSSPVAILVVSQEDKIVISNPESRKMFCGSSKTAATCTVDCMNDRSIKQYLPNFADLFKWSNQRAPYGDEQYNVGPIIWEDQIAYRADKSEFLVNITVFRYTYNNQRYTTLQIQDISSMRASAEDFQKASQQLTVLTQLVPVGIVRIDTTWNCLFANDKWYELSGLTSEENDGSGWINSIHSDDVKQVLESLRGVMQVGGEYKCELRLVSPLGQIRWVDFNTQVLFDENGAVQGLLATVADITERLLHQERLRHVAEYDALTGLANRNLLQDRLKQAFYSAEREHSDITVLFLDLDGFKDVNDSLGHDAGDNLLSQVAERLTNLLRRTDTIARFGGDEFVVLLSSLEHNYDVNLVASKIIEIIAEPYVVGENDVYVTASVGVASGNSENSSPEQILKQADAALYLAKAEGKNNYQLFSDDLDKEAKSRLHLAKQLRLALQNNRYFLAYQAQADVLTQEVVGFEALLRFKDEDDNVVTPDKFIPILEETGMIIEVGRWIINEACRQMSAWKKLGIFPKNGSMSINVSPKQLLDDSLISVFLNTCNFHGVEPSEIVVEVTETVTIDKPLKVQKAMEALKNIGVKLALDDFGTGYSSLTYLQRFPFDHIKIDKSFVADVITDENDALITKAIIALAKSLGLKITAEGVGDNDALEILKNYGANFFQGYFFSRPLEAHEIPNKLKQLSPDAHAIKVVELDIYKSSIE